MSILYSPMEEPEALTISHTMPYGVSSALEEKPFFNDSRFQTEQIYFLKNAKARKAAAKRAGERMRARMQQKKEAGVVS